MNLTPALERKILATPGVVVSGKPKRRRGDDLNTGGCGWTLDDGRMTITLPIPPTLNNYRTVARGRLITSTKGRRWCKTAVDLLAGGPKFCVARLRVTIHLHAKRRCDLDNFCKAALDSLKAAGVYADDSQVDCLTVVRGTDKTGRLVIVVEAI